MSIKLLLNILRVTLGNIKLSIYKGKFYNGAEFLNKKNIEIKKTSIIEKNTRIWATEPSNNEINIDVEDNCWIGRDVEIQTIYNSRITFKSNVSIQDRCKIIGDVYIGQDSLLAPDVFLSSGNHFFDFKPTILIKEQDKLVVSNASDFKQNSKQIVIGEDCWIGKNVMVQRGVNIGRGAIVAANSFVKKNIPPYEIWGGSPAKLLKKRIEFLPPNSLNYENENHFPYFYMGFDHKNIKKGFLSNNLSICVLRKDDQNVSLFLNGEILTPGKMKIWLNDSLVFTGNLNQATLDENIKITKSNNKDHVENKLYELIPAELKQYTLILFEFSPKNNTISQGFSINKISIHD